MTSRTNLEDRKMTASLRGRRSARFSPRGNLNTTLAACNRVNLIIWQRRIAYGEFLRAKYLRAKCRYLRNRNAGIVKLRRPIHDEARSSLKSQSWAWLRNTFGTPFSGAEGHSCSYMRMSGRLPQTTKSKAILSAAYVSGFTVQLRDGYTTDCAGY